MRRPMSRFVIFVALAAVCGFVAGLAVSRLVFEGLFPAATWAGQPLGALGLGAAGAVITGGVAWRQDGGRVQMPALGAVLLPLLLNMFWLADPAVDPARSRFLFGASVWMVVALGTWASLGNADRRWRWVGPLLVTGGLLPVYLSTMSHAVGAADTFEFQVVAAQLGIAHPTGYPLYLLLGKLFSLLPVGTVAWRLNLASAVFALAATVAVFRLGLALSRRPLPALVGAVALGLVPIYWSQAIVAEVYTLHALMVAVALRLMVRLLIDGSPRPANDEPATTLGPESPVVRRPSTDRKTMVALAFVLGLGLTNHLTTVFLLPPAGLAVALNLWPYLGAGRASTGGRISRRRSLVPLFLQLLVAFAVPLLLYAYLPLRWAAVNGEQMGFSRFVEWVIGGRFQGALQWGAWLRDPARREIVVRLILDAWPWIYLALAGIGLAWLFARQWRAALVLLITAAGFTFYALNYYVPDLAVFLIPAHVVIAVWVAAGVAAATRIATSGHGFFKRNAVGIAALVFVLALLPLFLSTGARRPAIDQSGRDGGEPWARLALGGPLARSAVLLADSEKIAPLYYLQQVEGLRRDLDIMVLPDEAAYRTELDARLAAGQPVYLARYLPGLEGVYHLRSAGPLVEVSREPVMAPPADVATTDQPIDPLRLVGYRLEPNAAVDSVAAITLYWTLDRPLREGERSPVVYLRWAGGDPVVTGLHPAADTYPVNAWRAEEVVADFHLLSLPDAHCAGPECALELQVAIAPRFTLPAELAWQTVTSVPVTPRPGPVGAPRRALFEGFALDGIDFPATARPGAPLPLRYSGYGDGAALTFLLVPPHATDSLIIPAGRVPRPPAGETATTAYAAAVEPATDGGLNVLIAYTTSETGAVCGWLARPTTGCVVAEIDISGAPLPEGATNFDGKIALLNVELEPGDLAPGGQLPVTLTWQGLTGMNEDYTVFVQVLDAADRIVGQVDAWPVQGTFPTSQWRPGEVITDPYVVQLSPDLAPGDYRLHVGLYLLATGQRLAVIDKAGDAVDDKVEVQIIPGDGADG